MFFLVFVDLIIFLFQISYQKWRLRLQMLRDSSLNFCNFFFVLIQVLIPEKLSLLFRGSMHDGFEKLGFMMKLQRIQNF